MKWSSVMGENAAFTQFHGVIFLTIWMSWNNTSILWCLIHMHTHALTNPCKHTHTHALSLSLNTYTHAYKHTHRLTKNQYLDKQREKCPLFWRRSHRTLSDGRSPSAGTCWVKTCWQKTPTQPLDKTPKQWKLGIKGFALKCHWFCFQFRIWATRVTSGRTGCTHTMPQLACLAKSTLS